MIKPSARISCDDSARAEHQSEYLKNGDRAYFPYERDKRAIRNTDHSDKYTTNATNGQPQFAVAVYDAHSTLSRLYII